MAMREARRGIRRKVGHKFGPSVTGGVAKRAQLLVGIGRQVLHLHPAGNDRADRLKHVFAPGSDAAVQEHSPLFSGLRLFAAGAGLANIAAVLGDHALTVALAHHRFGHGARDSDDRVHHAGVRVGNGVHLAMELRGGEPADRRIHRVLRNFGDYSRPRV